MSNGINLLSDKRNTSVLMSVKDRLKIFRFIAVVILFVVGASSVIISMLIAFSPLPQLRSEEQKSRADLAAFQVDMNKLEFINERGDSIRKILAARPSYDKKLDIVTSKMQADVVLDGLLIDKKKYTFRFSSKNLMSLDELINSLTGITGKGRDFMRVYLTSLVMDAESKKFVLVVDLFTI
jgi:hypothetical protein